MKYDGTTPLQPVIAELIGCSPKTQAKIAAEIKKAKSALGIKSKARVLPTVTRLQIFNYIVEINSQHENSNPVEIVSQDNAPEPLTPESTTNEPVEINSQPINNESVEIVSQSTNNEPVEIVSQNESNKSVELYSQPINDEPVEIHSQNESNKSVELYSQYVDNFDNVRIAFYTGKEASRKRQVIALDGFFFNALASINVSKQKTPQWLTQQVKDWTAFDEKLPVTKQVKFLIMREVVKGLSGSDDVFIDPTI